MDPELRKGFQELQYQVTESRSKIANIETFQKLTTHDAKINDSILEDFAKAEDIESKFFYQPVGRMLVKREGKAAHEFLLERQKQFQERLKQYKQVKEVCLSRVKESENSLRELVNKKLNKLEPQSKPEQDENKSSALAKDAQQGDSSKAVKDTGSEKGTEPK